MDGDVTASLVVERVNLTDSDGSISVSYAAFDSAGNVAKVKRRQIYRLRTPPIHAERPAGLYR